MFRRWRVVAVGLCLASSGAAMAKVRSAKPPAKVVLDYRRQAGAEACPTRPELESRVREILGRSPFARNAPRTVRCVLRGESAGLAARVQLLESRSGRMLGVRELTGTGPGCEELGGAVALAIALAIDPLARPPRPPPAATVTASPPLPPAPAPPSAATPPVASTATPPPTSSGAAGAAASAMGTGAVGASGAPRTGPPTRGLLPDAGPLGALGLGAVVLSTDAGRPPPLPDAGARTPDAGLASVDAGTAGRDAGPAALDAGTAGRDAGLLAPLGLAAVALAPAADAGRPPPRSDAGVGAADAGPAPEPGALAVADAGMPSDAGLATEAGEPALVAVPGSTSTGWRPVVGVEALGAAGVLPGFAGGMLIHAGAASSTASVEVEGRWLPGTRVAYGTGTISTSLLSAALVGCARFGPWGACAVAQAGPLSATGQGYSRSQEASPWMVSAGARVQWEWLFADPVGLRLHLDGTANLVRPRFLVDSQEAWAVPPFSVWVGGGLFGRF
jgi:hypothetical protein